MRYNRPLAHGFASLAVITLVAACGGAGSGDPSAADEAAGGTASANGAAPSVGGVGNTLDALEVRADRIAAEHEIKRLQRIYGYYMTRAEYGEIVDLLTDDATAEYRDSGVFVGKERVRELLLARAGGREGLVLGELRDHIQLQPVIHVAPDGQTAQGRWRELALLGRYEESAHWREGTYENEYRKVGGRWRISRIRYAETFTVPFTGGIAAQVDASAPLPADERDRAGAPLPQPDRRASFDDRPWPAPTELAPHYDNPADPIVAASAAAAAADPAVVRAAARDSLSPYRRSGDTTPNAVALRGAVLERQVGRLEDERNIEILQRTYGYYVDKNLWTQIADLFAPDGTLEIGGRGIFVGRDRALQYLEWLGAPQPGRLYDHTQMSGVVHVSPDGTQAKGRWRAIVFGGGNVFGDCIYENEYVKQDGVWKIAKLHAYFIMYTNWEQGWGRMGWPNTRPERVLPPDLPPTVVYDMYPGELTAPLHYENPVTGAPVYPEPNRVSANEDAPTDLAALERRLARLEDAADIERVHNAYGYYLDRRDWGNVATLFANDGTLEMGQRGVYAGRNRIRASLELLGPAGLAPGEVNANIQYQPVIHVAPDGVTAELRGREFVLAGKYGDEALIGGGVYENDYVKEDGVWRIASMHLYTTFLSDYTVPWSRGAKPIATASAQMPPDRPPTEVYEAFPAFHVPAFHYPNPVTGQPPVPPR